MDIAIIGTGNVGSALATNWAESGHRIRLGTRDPDDFEGEELLSNPETTVHEIAEAVSSSEVILVATPATAAEDLIQSFGNVSEKVIIDATNAVRKRPEPYPTAYHVFEDLTDADIVKCFNSTGFENMRNPDYGDHQLDMFMAGNSEHAKSIARQLATDAGFAACYDFGSGEQVELLEHFAKSWINLAIMQGMGRNIGFKLLKR